MAQMQMPKMYRQQKESWWQRTISALRPGPKPRLTEVTYRGAQPPQLTQTMKKIGEYRSDPLGFDTINVMRRYPVIKLGMTVKSAPILTALREARVECEDPKIAAFIKEVFVDRWLLKLAQTSISPSGVFGVAPHEKVWETQQVKASYVDDETGESVVGYDGEALVYKKIKFVHPQSIDRFLTQEGTQDFAGFVQIPEPGKEEQPVGAYKAFVYVNKFLYGGLWGESEFTDIYPYWYYAEFFRALQADYLRFRTVPPIIGWAPPGVREDEDGNEIDNLEYAGEVLQAALENLIVILPYEIDERGHNQWGYKEMSMETVSDVYTKGIEELEVGMLRGLVVPERTVTQNMAAVGSYNQAEIHSERMLDAAKMDVDNFLDACNNWCVPQLVEDNFGANSPPCKLRVQAFSEQLKTKLHNIVIALLQNDREGRLSRQVAFTRLLDQLNIPYVVGDTGLPEIQEDTTDEST
jgi:hypothetical protein